MKRINSKSKIDRTLKYNMLSFQIAFDLHIEYKNDEVPDPFVYIEPKAEILILAGDIGSFYKFDQLKTFLSLLCQQFKTVLYIPGNHEYYTVAGIYPKRMEDLLECFMTLEKEFNNFFILNRTSIQIGDVCIVGCTLWSHCIIPLPKYIVRIKHMDTAVYNTLHNQDVLFINKAIAYCKQKSLKLLVITHHAPTYDVTSSFSNKKKSYSSLYASNLNHLLSSDKVHTWVCGHVHVNFDYMTEGGTHLVGNQYGKPKDNITDYDKSKIIYV